MSIIDEIKANTTIVQQVGLLFEVTGRGRVLTTVEHDSLKLWPAENRWWWFSRGVGGDVIDWCATIYNTDLSTAIDNLARSLNLQRRPLTPEEQTQRTAAQRQQQVFATAASWFHAQIFAADRAGHRYCQSRGWTDETIRRETIGYNPSSHNNALSAEQAQPLANILRDAGLLDTPAAKAVLSLPTASIVYVHREFGRVAYLSARSIQAKRHWNPPADLVGGKHLYTNQVTTGSGFHLLVEGQADAIALGQLGVPATALCGVTAPELSRLPANFVGLDADTAGASKAVEIALQIDPLTPICIWPKPSKDAAEWLLAGATLDGLRTLAADAHPAIVHLAAECKAASGEKRQSLLRRLFDAFETLADVNQADYKERIAKALGGGISSFNRLLAARRKEIAEEKEKEQVEPIRRAEYSAGMEKDGILFEQCVWRGDDNTIMVGYAVRGKDGQVRHAVSVDLRDVTYCPFPASMGLIEKRVVLFPERAEAYGTTKALIATVQDFLHRYLDIDPFYEKLAAYYVLLSWLYDCFETLPYLRALGDYGTGKSRFLQTIGVLCYRPMFVSGASTVSPIFRLIDMFKGTLIIDEADFTNSDAEAEIIKILNVGYYKGGVVLRAEKDQNSDYDEYWPSAKDVYGPKILATRRPFTDRATESRCLTKRMTTARPRPEIPFILGKPFWAEATTIRNQLLRYRLDHHREIVIDHSLADHSVEPRLNQVTMALKSIVDDPAMRQDIDTFIRAYNDVLINDRQMTVAAIIIQAIAAIHWMRDPLDILGEDRRDLSMKGIAVKAQEIINEIDPDTRVNPKLVSKTLTEDLGLTRRGKHPRTRRDVLIVDENDLLTLMARYGIEKQIVDPPL